MDYMQELEEALTRIEYDLALLRHEESNWIPSSEEGMFDYRPTMPQLLIKKHVYDFIREVWHLGDGVKEILNYLWTQNKALFQKGLSLDHGNGPGKVIVSTHIRSCRWVQITGDLANLSKHYKLTRKTLSGGPPIQFGQQGYQLRSSGKIELGHELPDGTLLRAENPTLVQPTFSILDASGNVVGDVIDVGLRARESWLSLLKRYGVMFTPRNPKTA